MATYIVLNNFTEQGVRNLKDTTKRAESIREMAKKFGVSVKAFYWTLGSYDIVGVLEAPDDESIAALIASIGIAGNVRTQTMRAFTEADVNEIIAKLG